MLEVAEHLSEILGPSFQLLVIVNGYTQHLGSHDAGQRLSQVGNHIHVAFSLDFVQQAIGDLADMRAQHFDPLRSKRLRGEATQSSMGWRVQEKHLLDHDFSDRVQRRQAHLSELLRCRSALSGVVMKNRHYILVPRHHPGV